MASSIRAGQRRHRCHDHDEEGGPSHRHRETADAVGKSLLTVAAYTPQQWAAGQARYTSGGASCLSCHDPAAAAEMATDSGRAVEHAPEQTGGFNDVQLRRVFMNGELPDSDANPLHISAMRFAAFLKWQATDAEADGLVAFLRSLTPKSQGDLRLRRTRRRRRPPRRRRHGPAARHELRVALGEDP